MTKADNIAAVAEKMVRQHGLINLSLVELCNAAGIPPGSFARVAGCSFSDLVNRLRESTAHKSSQRKPVTKQRADPKLRKAYILSVALDLTRQVGCHKITRDEVAVKAQVSASLISRYFGTMPKFRRTIMRAAIAQEIPEIVAQGLANGDPHARKASDELKALAINTLS